MKKFRLLITLIGIALLFASCRTEADVLSTEETGNGAEVEVADTTGMLDNGEVHIVNVEFSDSSEIALDDVSGGSVIISTGGTYRLYGTLDGMVIIEAEKTDAVNLILDGVTINSADSAAIYVKKAASVAITLAAGSENVLSNGGQYAQIDENNIDGVLFSKSDLSLGGTGSLVITADAGHGIVSKDTLEIYDGVYTITSEKHGISVKDCLGIENGSFTIYAGKDGIHAENSEDAALGYIYIKGGTFAITSEGDGISAANSLQIDDIDAVITSGGGAENAVTQTNNDFGGGRFQWGMMTGTAAASTDETVSMKALKAGGDMFLAGGTITANSADDAIHSNGSITINAGEYQISAGDDGMHADLALTINDGSIAISTSYEGLEGQTIDINGGQCVLKSSDDGFNASGGNDSSGFGGFGGDMFASSDDVCITITGGTIYIDAGGDGIDSNGNLVVTGGEIYVAGPKSSGDGALDYNGEAKITGGTIIAVGASGMAETFGSTSTQGVIMVNTGNQAAGTTITLTDASDNVMVEYTFNKTFENIVISCPGVTADGTYTLTAGTYIETITMNSITYGGSGSGFGGMGGSMQNGTAKGRDFFSGDMSEMPEGEVPEKPEGDMSETPEGEVPEKPEGDMSEMPEGQVPEKPEGDMSEMPEGQVPGRTSGGFGKGDRM